MNDKEIQIRRYIEEIQPFAKIKADIISIQPCHYVIVDGKITEMIIDWIPMHKEIYEQIDDYIDLINERYSLYLC